MPISFFFFNLFIYLAVSGLSGSMQDLHCHAGSFTAVHGLSGWGTRAPRGTFHCSAWTLWLRHTSSTRDLSLQCMDSGWGTRAPERAGWVVTAGGFSCSEAYGILVPWPGIEPLSVPFIARWILNRWTTREVPAHFFFFKYIWEWLIGWLGESCTCTDRLINPRCILESSGGLLKSINAWAHSFPTQS